MTPASAISISRLRRAALLLATSAALLTLSLAPLGLPYLAWFGLAPWLIAVAESRSIRGAFVRGAGGGLLYFAMNVWWLWTVSISGAALLVLYLSLYWGVAAAVIHALGFLPSATVAEPSPLRKSDAKLGARLGPAGCVFGVAVVWVASEWLRCHAITGFPWLPLAVTQTPLVVMCQSADFGGQSIVSFWLVLVNALIAVAWPHRDRWGQVAPAAALVGLTLALNAAYGAWRLATTPLRPGPQVLVVQSNFRHLPGGAATRTDQEAVEFFLTELDARLAEKHADLALLPEAEFPPINEEARRELARAPIGPFLQTAHQRLAAIAAKHDASLVVGGSAVTGWKNDGSARVGSEIRNSAFYFPAGGREHVERYDKLHLVQFSERPPFANGPAWLRRLGLVIAAERASQPLTPGDARSFKPFVLTWPAADAQGGRHALHFISPICLEAIDPRLIMKMMHGASPAVARPGPAARQKPVDLFAVLSNDGWFATQEKWQHVRALAFRAIEHRVPLVRSSNTGISAWIDATGRLRKIVPANTTGAATMRIDLDDRVTFYSRYGDAFAVACLALATLAVAAQVRLSLKNNDHPAEIQRDSPTPA